MSSFHNFRHIILIALSLYFFNIDTKATSTIISTKDINVVFYFSNTNISEPVSFTGTYNNTERKFTLHFKNDGSATTHDIVLNEPPNLDYFSIELNKQVNDVFGYTRVIKTSSVLEIYFELMKLTAIDERVNCGELFFSQEVMVLNGGHHNYDDYETRTKYIHTLNNAINIANAILEKAKSDMKATIANERKKLMDGRRLELETHKTEIEKTEKNIANITRAIELLTLDSTMFSGKLSLMDTSASEKQKLKSAQAENNIKLGDKRVELLVAQEDLKTIYSSENISNIDADIALLSKIETDFILDTYDSVALSYELQKMNNVRSNVTVNHISETYSKYNKALKELNQQVQNKTDAGIVPINSLDIQFERGFLENIKVELRMDRPEYFENNYAIGFSSKNNFKNFKNTKLFMLNSSKIKNQPYIFLSDVFVNYRNFLENGTRDYCPADTSWNKIQPKSTPSYLFAKERIVNLFDSKIYTDLSGTGEKSPNGLVQIEVSRRFNINTNRNHGWFGGNFGIANYINIWASLNKIEQDKRFLPLRNALVVQNNTITSPSYATNLDFIRYTNATLGMDANIYLFDLPNAKVTGYLDVGFMYSHVPIHDSVKVVDTNTGKANIIRDANITPRELDAHLFTLQLPKLSLEFFSERRLSFKLGYQLNYTTLFSNNQIKQVVSYEKSDVSQLAREKNARWSHQLEFFLRIETSRDASGRIFFRSRFFWQQGDANTFFPQIQLGYAYNLIFKK